MCLCPFSENSKSHRCEIIKSQAICSIINKDTKLVPVSTYRKYDLLFGQHSVTNSVLQRQWALCTWRRYKFLTSWMLSAEYSFHNYEYIVFYQKLFMFLDLLCLWKKCNKLQQISFIFKVIIFFASFTLITYLPHQVWICAHLFIMSVKKVQ